MDWGDIAGSSGFQVGYPLLSALLAASGQRGANVAQGLNTGMVIANRYGEQRKADEQNKLLGQSLGSILKATTPVSSTSTVASQPVNPSTAEFSMPQPDDQVAAPPASVPLQKLTTTTQQPMYSPQAQKLGEALINARQPGLLLPTLMKEAIRDPKLTAVRPGGALVDEQGNLKYQAPAAPVREPTPPRPVIGTQGGEGVTTIYNPVSKQWELQRTPLTAAPARLVSPEDKLLKGAETNRANAQAGSATSERDLRQQRLKDLKQAANDINNPNASKDKITTAISVLVRQNEGYARMPPEEGTDEFADWQTVKHMLRGANARLDKLGGYGATGGGGTGAPKPAPQPAIAYLKAHPESAPQFKEKYGYLP